MSSRKSNGNITGGLNIYGVLDLDQMAETLNEMMERLNKQDSLISALQRTSEVTYSSSDSLAREVSAINKAMDEFAQHLDIIQPAVSVEFENKRYSVADISLMNSQQILNINKELTECISRAEVEQQYQSLVDIRISNIKLQRNMEKSTVLLDQISKTQLNINNRLSNIELSLTSKLDKAEFSNVEAAVAKLELYEDFRQTTLTSLTSYHEFEKAMKTINADYKQQLQNLFSTQASLEKQLLNKSSTLEVAALSKEIQKILSNLETCAQSSDVKQIARELDLTKKELATLSGDSHSLRASIQDLTEHQLPSKAPLSALSQLVSRRHYEQAINALGTAIDSKSSEEDAANLRRQLQEIESKLKDESAKVSVAMRFVEWFTSRGEGYEHNLRAIDRHLQQLVPPSASPSYSTLTGSSSAPVLRSRVELGLPERRQQLSHSFAMLQAQRDQLRGLEYDLEDSPIN